MAMRLVLDVVLIVRLIDRGGTQTQRNKYGCSIRSIGSGIYPFNILIHVFANATYDNL
jgi:hypothetical protein